MNKFKIGDIIHFDRNSFSCRGFLTVMVIKPWEKVDHPDGAPSGYSVYTLNDEAGYLKGGDIHFLTSTRAKLYELRNLKC